MIADILSRLFWMSLTGTVVIAAVLLLRILFRHAPKIFSYLLWGAVLFRLLCPFAPESGFSVVLREISKPQTAGQTNKQIQEENDALDQVRQFVSKEAERGTVFSSKENKDTVLNQTVQTQVLVSKNMDTAIFIIWILGMAAMFLQAAVSELRLRKFLHHAVCEEKNIYIVSGIDTPFALGMFFPKIYLPAGLSVSEREYMILHEQTHIRRKDLFFRRLSYLALLIHWFNPLVWCAFFLSGRDMEMSCDEAVVKRLGNSVKQAYSNSLLKISATKAVGVKVPTAFGGCDTKKRIHNILRYQKAKKSIAALCVLVLFAAALMLTTNPKRTTASAVSQDTQMPVSQTQMTGNLTEADSFHEDAGGQETSASGEAVVLIKSISLSAKAIDYMQAEEEISRALGDGPAFSENCSFFINDPIESFIPHEVSFKEFADKIGGWEHELLKPCMIEYADGLVQKITLLGIYIPYGICYEPLPAPYNAYDEIKQAYGKDVLEKYYTLVSMEELDVADCAGTEIIEVYTGNTGYGDTGIVLVKDAGGKIIYSAEAFAARAGWSNIYAGKVDGGGEGFLMTLNLENREIFGIYSYQVFRIGADGEKLNQLAGSVFEWDQGNNKHQYDADEFAKFCHMMGHHLDDSHLLLSTQQGELRTNGGSDSDIYCYKTLAPSCFENPYEGMDIR